MSTSKIQIVGPGCPLCKEMEDLVRVCIRQHNIAATVDIVTDFQQIVDLGVFAPPALLIDQVIKTVGRVPEPNELLGWLENPAPEVEEIIF